MKEHLFLSAPSLVAYSAGSGSQASVSECCHTAVRRYHLVLQYKNTGREDPCAKDLQRRRALQGSSWSSAADLTVPVVLRSVRMVRRFGDELIAVDANAVVVVIVIVTAAQVLAFYKALEHEHEAVQTVAPSLETGGRQ